MIIALSCTNKVCSIVSVKKSSYSENYGENYVFDENGLIKMITS